MIEKIPENATNPFETTRNKINELVDALNNDCLKRGKQPEPELHIADYSKMKALLDIDWDKLIDWEKIKAKYGYKKQCEHQYSIRSSYSYCCVCGKKL